MPPSTVRPWPTADINASLMFYQPRLFNLLLHVNLLPCSRSTLSLSTVAAASDCAPLVHRAIALCDLREPQYEVEDLPRIDSSLEDELDQLRPSVSSTMVGSGRSSNRTSRSPYRTVACITYSSYLARRSLRLNNLSAARVPAILDFLRSVACLEGLE
jgi:hypothetical protein